MLVGKTNGPDLVTARLSPPLSSSTRPVPERPETVPPIVNPVPVPVPPVEVELCGKPLQAASATAAASNCRPKIDFRPDFIMSCSFERRSVFRGILGDDLELRRIQSCLPPKFGGLTHPHYPSRKHDVRPRN